MTGIITGSDEHLIQLVEKAVRDMVDHSDDAIAWHSIAVQEMLNRFKREMNIEE
ncbi:MAG: hypothetical protein V3T23_03900 [Nitrososphaerales archaeon]